MMPSTLRLVHSEREVSLSSLWRATQMATSVGTEVNNDTTSKDTKVSSFSKTCDLMNSTNALEFLTRELVRPTNGANNRARNLDSSYVGEDLKDTMGHKGTSGL